MLNGAVMNAVANVFSKKKMPLFQEKGKKLEDIETVKNMYAQVLNMEQEQGKDWVKLIYQNSRG